MIAPTTHTSLSGSRLASSSATQAGKTPETAVTDKAGIAASAGNASTTSSVSSWARQLGEAAARAEIRDSSLSRKELGEKAATQLSQITGSQYFQQQAQHNAQVLATDDPELLARAQQATRFVNGADTNPFKGLSADQLALIAYDEGETFTVNERRAAWLESDSQRQAWQQQAAATGLMEHNLTGKMTGFHTETLIHYNLQPAIEQARYPENYADRLQAQISENYPAQREAAHPGKDSVDSAANTVEQLFASTPHANDMEEHVIAAANAQAAAAAQAAEEPAYINPKSTPAYKLMVDRLFGGKEPPVGNKAEGMSGSNIGRRPHEFLSSSDRVLLSEIYAYAQAEGADLKYVDDLAYQLGDYRQHNDGQLSLSFNNGHSYDAEGRQLTVSFNEKDTATASRILNGSARYTTEIDHGFLRHLLDPGFGAPTNFSNLEFLEQVVNKFSAENIEQESSLADKFGTYKPMVGLIGDNVVFTANENVRLKPSEPDIVKVNGVYTLTEKGRAAGITMDEVHGRTSKVSSASIRQEMNQYILDAFFNKKDSTKTHASLIDLLNQRETNFKTKRSN